jgi:type VI secretion system protein ImpM
MGFGLFGKLPQKRDFITFGIPGDILNPLETWLQTAVAASRNQLGRTWEETYLVAPIWRFWIGADVFGLNCAGAIMPSVDGVGRFFPLLALYSCEPGQSLPPPSYAPQDKWFGAIEARLLQVLEDDEQPAVDAILQGLPAPAFEPAELKKGLSVFRGGHIWAGEADMDMPSFLATIFEDDYRQVVRGRSYWWTSGNGEAGPVLHARNGLPDPYFHTRMLGVVAG